MDLDELERLERRCLATCRRCGGTGSVPGPDQSTVMGPRPMVYVCPVCKGARRVLPADVRLLADFVRRTLQVPVREGVA